MGVALTQFQDGHGLMDHLLILLIGPMANPLDQKTLNSVLKCFQKFRLKLLSDISTPLLSEVEFRN